MNTPRSCQRQPRTYEPSFRHPQGEAALTRAVTEVVGPAPEDWVERVDERFEREVRRGGCGQLLDSVHDLAQRSFAWEAVGERRSTGARAAHDAKPEQVEAVVDVGDARFLGRERQAQLLAHALGRLLLER